MSNTDYKVADYEAALDAIRSRLREPSFEERQDYERRLFLGPLDGPLDDDMLDIMEWRNVGEAIPPCRVCGDALTYQGNWVYRCEPVKDGVVKPGRVVHLNRVSRQAQLDESDHRERSVYRQQRRTDTEVLRLMANHRRLLKHTDEMARTMEQMQANHSKEATDLLRVHARDYREWYAATRKAMRDLIATLTLDSPQESGEAVLDVLRDLAALVPRSNEAKTVRQLADERQGQ